MDSIPTNRSITIINIITGSIIDKIDIHLTFRNSLQLFLEKYKGPNEDYAKLICNDKIINSINIYKIDRTFTMPDDTDIIYMIKGYKRDVYIIKNNDDYSLIFECSYYDRYYSLLNYLHIPLENIMNYSHKELILSLLQIRDFRSYKLLRPLLTNDMLDDYDIMLRMCIICSNMFVDTSDRLKDNEEFIINLTTQNLNILEYVSFKIKNNYNIILEIVTNNGLALSFASEELKDNYNIVLFAVKNNSNALEYASDRLINDRDIVITAFLSKLSILDINDSLYYAGKELMNNCNFVSQLIKFQRQSHILQYASNRVKDNYKIVLAAIKLNINDLPHASIRLRDNYKIVLAAVKKYGVALQYASNRMRNNYTIVFFAVLNDAHALQYASDRLKDNYNIVLTAIKNNAYGLLLASDRLKDNYKLVLKAVIKNGNVLSYVSNRLRNNYNIILAAQQQHEF